MQIRSPLTFLRGSLGLTVLLGALTLYHIANVAALAGTLYTSPKWWLVLGAGALVLVFELAVLGASWSSARPALFERADRVYARLAGLGRANWVLFGLLVGLYAYLVLGPFGYLFQTLYTRLFLFSWVVLLGGLLLQAGGLKTGWLAAFTAAALFAALGYKAAAYLPEVNNYPFTLTWSEASRYYYASLYFSSSIYGSQVPPTVLHPTRYLLQSIPFLIPSLPIVAHRFWQVLLWIGITFATAWVFARQLDLDDRPRRWMALAWAFLFLLVGPVYYHLQIPILIILAGFGRRQYFARPHFWKALALVALASAWAGISRVNWFPVPGMLAAILYFIHVPLGKRPVWKYPLLPLLWTFAGTGIAFAAQAGYALVSGNPTDQFTSSFSSDLLWYRLLPNPTYPAGILLSTLAVSLPLILVIAIRLLEVGRRFHFIRLAGIGSILLVLLAGGLVVSVKIGGGSNLHNLDAYLALLMVAATYLYFYKFSTDVPAELEAGPETTPEENVLPAAGLSPRRALLGQAALALALLLPVYFALSSGGPLVLPLQEQTDRTLEVLQRYIADLNPGDEVLFMGERQLLTFHILGPVKLVPDYERVFLMEMVMAGNPIYLEKFHSELKAHRFALIVSEPLYLQKKGSQESFGEENDAWVKYVSRPVLCSYRPKNILTNMRIQLLLPRAGTEDCP